MNKKIYRLKPGMSRIADLFHLDTEYAMEAEEKLKFDKTIESFKGKQNEFDISEITIEAYPLDLLIHTFGTDVYGINSQKTVSIPVNRVYFEPFYHYEE